MLNSSLRKYQVRGFIGAFLFVLTLHFLFRKHAIGHQIALDNWTMLMVSYFDIADVSHPYYSFFAKIAFLLSGALIQMPLIYLASLLLLKIGILLALYLIYKQVTPHEYVYSLGVVVAIFAIFFFTIGGGGRFGFGESPISSTMDLYVRSWSQLLALFSLLLFFKRQYLRSSGLLVFAGFFHLVNTLNLFIVLLAGLFVIRNFCGDRTRNILLFSFPVIVGIFLQVLIASGLDFRQIFLGTEVNTSVKEWYEYVYMQDVDDLSFLYRLTGRVGLPYVLFQIVGLYLATKTEGIRRASALLRHPVLSICFTTYAFLIGAALVEWLQMPAYILEKLIILQPRRIASLPVLILCYYIVRYAFEYFWIRKNTTFRYSLTLIGFVTWYLLTIYLTNDLFSLTNKTTVILFVCSIIIIAGYNLLCRYVDQTDFRNITRNFVLLGSLALVLVTVRTAPFVTADTSNSIRSMYFSIKPRSYINYFLVEQRLKGREQFSNDIISASEWMKSNTRKTDVFLSVDFESGEIGHLVAFSERIFIQSLDLRHYRGPGMGGGHFATHYDRKSYQMLSDYLESFLNISMAQVTNLGRDAQLALIREILLSFTSAELKQKKSIFSDRIDYILSKRKIPNLVSPIYSERGIFIYSLNDSRPDDSDS